MKREFSAGLIIFNQENNQKRYLILRYGYGHWDFPKGHIEKGESKREAALRELEEETGLTDAKIIDGFEESFSYHFKNKKGELILKEVCFFIAESYSKDITLSIEHTDYKWLLYKEALEIITYDNARNVLRNADSFLA